ncbi:MAG: glycosyltransferase family 2 protein [Acidobacteriota bacterium]
MNRQQIRQTSIGNSQESPRVTFHEDIFSFAAFLGDRFDCSYIISIGCGDIEKLEELYPRFNIIGIDVAPNLKEHCERRPSGTRVEWDIQQPGSISLPEEILKRAIIVCINLIEQLIDPTCLLETLKGWLDHAPVCLLASANSGWDDGEFEMLLHAKHYNVAFVGSSSSDGPDQGRTALAVIANNAFVNPASDSFVFGSLASDFRVVAIMTTYNEEDIIAHSIKRLIDQGVDVYVIDNWSTDNTYHLAKQFEGRGLIGIERLPADGPSAFYNWRELLMRVEELSGEMEADWFIHHDADEIRLSPWAGVSLREGLYAVDRAGFNCIDQTVIVFHPVDNGFTPGQDFGAYYKYFEFDKHPAHRIHMKAWKNLGQDISLAESGGHQAQFEGRRVYPYKFLLKHYPIRSQMHGEKKVLFERQLRWNSEERAAGWHVHYDDIKEGHRFLRSTSELELFDELDFNRKYLIERLSGIGVSSWDLTKAASELDSKAELAETPFAAPIGESLEELKRQLAEKEQAVKELTGQLSDSEETILARDEGIAWLTAEVNQRDKIILARDEAIKWLSTELSKKEEALQQLSAQAELQDARESLTVALDEQQQQYRLLLSQGALDQQKIEELSMQLAEQREKIDLLVTRVAGPQDALGSQISEKESLLRALHHQLDQKEESAQHLMPRLVDTEKTLALRNEAVNWLMSEVAQKDRATQALSLQLMAKESELDRITSSLGWRMLSLYGRIKYRYLLPIYRMLGLMPKAKKDKAQ